MATLKSTTIAVPSNGEITINLNLNIKIDGDGKISVSAGNEDEEKLIKQKNIIEKDNSSTLLDWQMPEITKEDLINFGNKTKG